ncbi:nuclear transport factor 2 family protein [Pseudorhodoferax sp.]|uniref:nuclear transport factor 2 family protein n=1 Tax=Pseudorhodoferax sp. TaxID=1993553 RepID=UPI0039E66D5D
MMKKWLSAAFVVWALAGCHSAPTVASESDVAAVTDAVEQFRRANIQPTQAGLSNLLVDELSYGHSGAKVDTKASLISDLISGSVKFTSLTFSDQTIKIVRDAAIVRHRMAADALVDGKPIKVNLLALQVWQKRGTQWKLLARQAVAVPQP